MIDTLGWVRPSFLLRGGKSVCLSIQALLLNRRTAEALGLLLVVFVAYIPAFQAAHIWDDNVAVFSNLDLRTKGGLARIWSFPAYHPYEIHYWPLVYTTFWVEWHLWKGNYFGYHLVNVLLHALNTLMLLAILRRMKLRGAFLGAAIFALHPVHVESVAWITERKDVLSGFFYLSAFWSYFVFHGRGSKRHYVLSIILFICATLSKTIAVTLPFALTLYLWWKNERLWRRELIPLIPFFILSLLMGLADSYSARHSGAAVSFMFLEKVMLASRNVLFYLGQMVWPRILIAVYPKWTIDLTSIWQYLLVIAVVLITVLLYCKRERLGRGLLAVYVFYIATLLPILGFVRFGYMSHSFVADRYQYLASIGPIVAFAAGIAVLLRKLSPTLRLMVYVQVSMLLFVLGMRTWQTANAYRTMGTLFSHTVMHNPESPTAHLNWGGVLANHGRVEEAMEHYRAALREDPQFSMAYASIGALLNRQGKTDRALRYCDLALRLDPHCPMAYQAMGAIYARQRDYKMAARYYSTVLQYNPHNMDAFFALMAALDMLDQYELLVYAASYMLELDPENPRIHGCAGEGYMMLENAEKASEHFQKAVSLAPRWMAPKNQLAWIWATAEDENHRNGPEAVEMAESASAELTVAHPIVMDTLAAAYAEAGRFEEAIEAGEEAATLAREMAASKLAEAIEARVELYKQGRSFHAPFWESNRNKIVTQQMAREPLMSFTSENFDVMQDSGPNQLIDLEETRWNVLYDRFRR